MVFLYYKLIISLFVLFIQIKQLNSCSEKDLQSLSAFKRDLTDPRDRLSSWTGDNCCSWKGITCNKHNPARVVKINLRNPAGEDDSWALGGRISPSLLQVSYLSHLDLSFNDFEDVSIPTFFGSFPELRYLNLSGAGFEGNVPSHLGNLSTLRTLDLSNNLYLRIDGSLWIANLNSLEHLDLSYLIFDEKFGGRFPQNLQGLCKLESLHLSWMNIPGELSIFQHMVNGCSKHTVENLDLGGNQIVGTLPSWLGELSNLRTLQLYENQITGSIPADEGLET